MPVPNDVTFGPDENGKPIFYGHVRSFSEINQFHAIHRRVATFFVKHTQELGLQPDGSRKVYSPFPLFLLTCVGIETLGKIFYGRALKNGERREDLQREGFMKVSAKMHQKLSRPLSKPQKEAFDTNWGEGEHEDIDSVATILYKYGRHTMMHGYQGRGVYLTEEPEVSDLQIRDGGLIINPYTLWKYFTVTFDRLWADFFEIADENHPQKMSMRLYRSSLID